MARLKNLAVVDLCDSSDNESMAYTKPGPQIVVPEAEPQLDPDVMEMETNSVNNKNQSPSYEVEKIIDKREKMGNIEYLVQWKGYSTQNDSWEPKSSLTENCSVLLADFENQWNIEFEHFLNNMPKTKSRRYGKRRRFASASTLSPPPSD